MTLRLVADNQHPEVNIFSTLRSHIAELPEGTFRIALVAQYPGGYQVSGFGDDIKVVTMTGLLEAAKWQVWTDDLTDED